MVRTPRRHFIAPVVLAALTAWSSTATIRVGISQNPPLKFTETTGRHTGLFVELLREMGKAEGWDLTCRSGTFSECLEWLETGAIDVIPNIGYSLERAEHFHFCKENVIATWAQVYCRPERRITTLPDMDGLTVAVQQNDFFVNDPREGFLYLAGQFGIRCSLVEVPTYMDVLSMVAGGQAEVGIVNRLVGDAQSSSYRAKKTPVIFSPVGLRFAFSRRTPGHAELAATVDRYTRGWRDDPSSVYYRLLDRFYPIRGQGRPSPYWYLITALLLVAALVCAVQFRRRVKAGARAIEKLGKTLETALAELPTGVVIADAPSGVSCRANAAALGLMGMEPQGGRSFAVSALVESCPHLRPDGTACPREEIPLVRALAQGRHAEVTAVLLDSQDKGRRYVLTSAAPVRTSRGVLVGAVAVYSDITRQREIEEERLRLEGHLRRAQKMEAIGTLSGGIAHDFNNILSAVVGYVDLCLDDLPEGSQVSDNLRQVIRASEHARDLIKQILVFSRPTDESRTPVNIGRLVKEVVTLVRASIPENVEIELEVDPAAGRVLADATQLHQVIMNLCTNAWQAIGSASGKITILCRGGHETPPAGAEDAGWVVIEVSDTGRGMNPTTLERIFDPYFTTKQRGEGTGLGLSVARGIVTAHGGRITVSSQVKEGTTFRIELPATKTADAPSPVRVPSDNLPEGKGTILLAEDHEVNRTVFTRLLARMGYSVVSAPDGAAALKLFLEAPAKFDIVLTDMVMPHMSGLELARHVHRRRPDLPLLIITGYSEALSNEQAAEAGVRAVLKKPVTRNELAQALREATGTSGQTG